MISVEGLLDQLSCQEARIVEVEDELKECIAKNESISEEVVSNLFWKITTALATGLFLIAVYVIRKG